MEAGLPASRRDSIATFPEPDKSNSKMKGLEPVDIPAFASRQLELLETELQSELAENSLLLSSTATPTLQRAGLAILNLTLSAQRTGLGGKTVIELELDPAIGGGEGQALPEHGVRVGDIVGVGEQPKGREKKRETAEMQGRGVEGVVVKVGQSRVVVALGKEDEEVPGGKLWLFKLANDVTYKRMNQTMRKLSQLSPADHTPLMRVLFGHSPPSPPHASLPAEEFDFLTPGLNESQKEAVRFALAAPEVALIHGPPGTGKTQTLIELIRQFLRLSLRVLVCGPSNISVDNIVSRLPPTTPMVRLGHPARLLPAVLAHSLDVLTTTSPAAAIVRDVRRELDEQQARVRKTRSGKERRAVYAEMRELRKEYRVRERRCVGELVRTSRVVLGTLHGVGGWQLGREVFDVVVVDEASMALESQCWVALLGAKKVVLAGDHLQLPPTVKSANVKGTAKGTALSREQAGLERTLFDRLLEMYGDDVKRMLTVQYRMNEEIMRFPSEELYGGKLVAHEAVRGRLLSDMEGVAGGEDTDVPVVLWDTQGGEFPEGTEDEEIGKRGVMVGESKSNEMEALVVAMHVRKLVKAGVKPDDIAVLTPYNAQLALLSRELREKFPGIELGSVDGFQGREKEAVIVSLVRSNAEGEVGFLGEKRRLNVAMTRPKRHLCVVGDTETVSRGSPFLKRWMAWLEEHADLRYPDLTEVHVSLRDK